MNELTAFNNTRWVLQKCAEGPRERPNSQPRGPFCRLSDKPEYQIMPWRSLTEEEMQAFAERERAEWTECIKGSARLVGHAL